MSAIQIAGIANPDKKRAITAYTKDSITFEISLENDEGVNYLGDPGSYKEIV